MYLCNHTKVSKRQLVVSNVIKNPEQSEYTDGFPSDFEHPNLKNTEGWIKQWAKAFWATADSQTSAYNFNNDRARFVNNRDYSEGQYPVEDFENLGFAFGGDETDTTYLNIDKSVETPLPTIVSRLAGMIYNNPFEVNVKPIDPESLTEEDVELKKIQLKIKTKELQKKAEQAIDQAKMAGAKMPGQKEVDPKISVPDEELPKDSEEFRIFRHTRYKPARAAASESLLRWWNDRTRSERLRMKNARDLIDLKIAGRKIWLEPETKKVNQRDVDPVNLVASWVKQDDFSDAKAIGEIIYPTVDEIRMNCPEIPESELFEIAKQEAGNRNNPEWMYNQSASVGDTRVSYHHYKDFTVSVLDAEFFSVDVYEKRKKKARNGGYYYQTLDENFRKPKKPKHPEEYIEKKIKSIYKFKLIINTEYIYDYGRKENTLRKIRDGIKEDPCFSWVVFAPNIRDMRNKSHTERAIPHVKQLVLIQLKLQQHIANATPAGHAWDVDAVASALNGMGMDGSRPIDIIKMRKEIGDTFFKSKDESSMMNTGTQPVYDLKSSLDETIERLGGAYNAELTRLYETLGINNAAGRAAPNKDMLNAQEEMALMATQDSFREIQQAFLDIEKRSNEIALMYFQKIFKHDAQKRKSIERAIGDENVKIFDLSKLTNAELGITINMLPNGRQLQTFQKYLEAEVKVDAISSTDALALENYAQHHGVYKAEIILEHRKAKYAKEKEARAEAESQRQIKQRQAEQQAIAQAEQVKSQAEAQSKMAIDNNEYQLKTNFEREKSEMDKERLAVEWDFKKEAIKLQQQIEAGSLKDKELDTGGTTENIPRPAPRQPDTMPSTRVSVDA